MYLCIFFNSIYYQLNSILNTVKSTNDDHDRDVLIMTTG